MPYKQPISILLVIHTPDLQILLLERCDFSGAWQSVTGSCEANESLIDTAVRELFEETGLQVSADAVRDWQHASEFEIFARWRHRYAPGVTHNTEHVFSVAVPSGSAVTLSPREHTQYRWVGLDEAIEMVFSPSNADALQQLPSRLLT
ncbi:dihydroneopterin triphosphate diphosphatase [uncultured Deefgea sp.]|uniref:dihydroneopterin triphosphate diphosphatase n=1 Tax=uncultured Deefgea sp. TaxID=1304914 RepID=UPI00259480AD|nr:dihydroneopterin triphosphate diphosphatase [uncultured Deefgea sp.]